MRRGLFIYPAAAANLCRSVLQPTFAAHYTLLIHASKKYFHT
jgi:hypothetical protein